MNPPANPHALEARAAMMAHNAPLLQNPPREDAATLLSLALAQQPDPERYAYLRRYADTATVETMTMQHAQSGEWMQARCVTVTVYDAAATAAQQPAGAEGKIER